MMFMFRHNVVLSASVLVFLSAAAVPAQEAVKVAGDSFFPGDLIFGEADPKSVATGEGSLPDECKWELRTSTRVAREDVDRTCRRYFYKTGVVLTRKCPAPQKPKVVSSERITTTGPHCAEEERKLPPPKVESRAISSGMVPDGRRQEIVEQPDGTRVVIRSDATGVEVRVSYPDRTTDVLKIP